MKNTSVSEFVASAMDTILKSDAHKSLFASEYKSAQTKTPEQKLDEVAKQKVTNPPDPGMKLKNDDGNAASDSNAVDDNDAKKDTSEDTSNDSCDADDSDEDDKVSTAFDIAIDSLLTASAALDSVGMEKSSTFSLKLASLVVEAKKKDKKNKKDKKDKKSTKDSKKSDKKDSKKDSSKDSKKSSKSSK